MQTDIIPSLLIAEQVWCFEYLTAIVLLHTERLCTEPKEVFGGED